jgi:hypothetical protein
MKLLNTAILASSLLGAGLLLSCGNAKDWENGDSANTKEVQPTPIPDDKPTYFTEMPVCDKVHLNRLVFVVQDHTYLICKKDGWVFLDPNADVSDEVQKCTLPVDAAPTSTPVPEN